MRRSAKSSDAGIRPRQNAATVVIPNWNGRDLLERYLPSIEAALSHNEATEILVVDNGSTDGSVDFLRTHHPRVKTLALDRNLGFGGGSNAGFRAARNDIVVLLNSDMRVQPDLPRSPLTATVIASSGFPWCAWSAAKSPAPPEPSMSMSVFSDRIEIKKVSVRRS